MSMKNLRNSVQLIGRLGQEPEQRQLPSGRSLTTFSLATSERYTNAQGQQVIDTQWHQIVMWGKTAELAASLLRKGREVLIEGKLVYDQYQDKQGNKRTRAKVVANSFLLMEREVQAA